MTRPIDVDIEQQISTSLKLIKILLGFFVFTTITLTLLPQFGIVKLHSTNSMQSLLPTFLIIALFLAVNGFILRKVLSKTSWHDDLQEHASACIKSFHLAHLVAFVVFEAIGLLGFVNYILSDNPNSALLFGTVSVACMLIAWPKGEVLMGKISAVQKKL